MRVARSRAHQHRRVGAVHDTRRARNAWVVASLYRYASGPAVAQHQPNYTGPPSVYRQPSIGAQHRLRSNRLQATLFARVPVSAWQQRYAASSSSKIRVQPIGISSRRVSCRSVARPPVSPIIRRSCTQRSSSEERRGAPTTPRRRRR